MDLLGGYGSGSDSDPGSPQPASNTGTATLLTSRLPVQAAPPVAQQPPTDPSQLASRLPAPSGAKVLLPCRQPVERMLLLCVFPSCSRLVGITLCHRRAATPSKLLPVRSCVQDPSSLCLKNAAAQLPQAPLFSGLPKPAQKKKVVVQFRVPISYDPADVKAVEEVGRAGWMDGQPAGLVREAGGRWRPLRQQARCQCLGSAVFAAGGLTRALRYSPGRLACRLGPWCRSRRASGRRPALAGAACPSCCRRPRMRRQAAGGAWMCWVAARPAAQGQGPRLEESTTQTTMRLCRAQRTAAAWWTWRQVGARAWPAGWPAGRPRPALLLACWLAGWLCLRVCSAACRPRPPRPPRRRRRARRRR